MDRGIIKDAIKYYGEEVQAIVCMEECAELIKAISKTIRDPEDDITLVNLAEEMADVTICLNTLQHMYGIPNDMLDSWIRTKQMRMQERMRQHK